MIDTNTFLSIGLTLVSNLANVVPLPSKAVPRTTNDLQRYAIGSPLIPVELMLMHKNGSHFWIRDGVVEGFDTPGSYFSMQDPDLLPRFLGNATMTTQEVVALATNTFYRLGKNGNPLANAVPFLKDGGEFNGQTIPFYQIFLHKTNNGITGAGDIEIDARKRQVVSMHLFHWDFYDDRMAQQISNRVYTPEPRPPPPERITAKISLERRKTTPWPATNHVIQSIEECRRWCESLGAGDGSEFAPASVEWDRSMVYSNRWISPPQSVSQIWFTNGACIESVRGKPLSFFLHDACFVGIWDRRPAEEWAQFQGKVVHRWQDLAKNLESLLVEKLGVHAEVLSAYRVGSRYVTPEMGSEACVRFQVEWRRPKPGLEEIPLGIDETAVGLVAEFDLANGRLKSLSFKHLDLLPR